MAPHRITLNDGADIDGFRQAVRRLIFEELAPQHVVFAVTKEPDLFGHEVEGEAPAVSLPRAVGETIGLVICHRDPERYTLLYQLVWRVLNGERELLEIPSDPLVHRLDLMAHAVRRDLHKMHAFLRFRRVGGEHLERFVAWFEPDHFILEAAAPFFVDRFRSIEWSILTPIGSLHWDRETLTLGPSARREDVPDEDDFEADWLGYYESMLNPARENPRVVQAEMPEKVRHIFEPAAVTSPIQTASKRVEQMIEQESTMPTKRNPDHTVEVMWDEEPKSLRALNTVIAEAGPLVPGATQAVFGEGPAHADIVFVGEQPGDQEDRQGRPFVGPAGRLFDKALKEAGIDRDKVYLTNAVKHFKFEQRGHRRIHSKPTAGEVKHYRPWLMKELELVKPKLVVALGGTALLALTGKSTPISRSRGRAMFGNMNGYITVHPSYLLRLPDEETKRQAYEAFVRDLAHIRDLAKADLTTGELPLAAE
ncbi:UdgX family uracil-DNA binding protein [Microvirga puerhi]|uniref:Type-4 uracil-DNA glycosylase n=1 Tax=Microvirga puerhi TaxID=2876078 RepID=A0ABS7VPV7_9HYPH|nr:UdgX family uracil-DNA binding protein [Microvirga puerhi]MBZ6077155.1 UdgX family uracil-DNA binding protein [Microvirga puerhi]